MNIGGYDAFDDPYSYKGTAVLKNRLRTKDPAVLQAFELEMTTLRAAEPLPQGAFDPAHYRAVHHHLFQDVYRWAGKYRTIRTSKNGNMFCYPEHIPREMDKLFAALHAEAISAGISFPDFVEAAASFLAELNAIHPFREGNGRTQLSFLHLTAVQAGHPLALRRVDPNRFLQAMIISFGRELKPLIRELTTLRA